ncbi:prepilin peptidase [Candidatus Saccharibacteria bacterium]|nr:prepilin peptidase [Candidatus Saccharibacteria bacterium]
MLIMAIILSMILASFFVTLGFRVKEFMIKNQEINYSKLLIDRSRCDNCQIVLNPLQLVPIFGLIFYRGRCPKCQSKITKAYIYWEIIYSVGFVSLLGYGDYRFELVTILDLIFFSFGIVGVITDYYQKLLPDFVLKILVVVGGLEFLLISPDTKTIILQSLVVVLLIAINWLSKERFMGNGDLWLIVGVNLSLSDASLVVSYLVAIYSATLIGIIGMATKKLTIKSSIAFGPFILLGWWVAKLSLVDFKWLIESLRLL